MFPDGICRSPVTWNDSTPDHYVRILSHLNEVAQLRYGKCIIQHVIVAEDEDIITMDILGMVLDVGEHATHIQTGMIESLTMTATSTVIGVVLAIPVGLGAARNLAPLPVYLVCRGIIALSRTFQEVIIAILFVAMFGFGPLAGVLTLAFVTIGFLAKLLAEDIEDTDRAPIEAIRATGASWLQLVNYGIQPQVMPRLIGLSVYRLDINFRESAVIGIVGAGGVGATLNTAFDRYEYDTAAAILITIIVIVMATEYLSSVVRRRVQ